MVVTANPTADNRAKFARESIEQADELGSDPR